MGCEWEWLHFGSPFQVLAIKIEIYKREAVVVAQF